MIIVSPTGRFAVVHAGWRGVHSSIAVHALEALAIMDASQLGGEERAKAACNVYVGPHIRGECFETGEDVHTQFVRRFGEECAHDATHISLLRALTRDFVQAGVREERIADSGICTACESQSYFSYRASGGTCGRHGALAVRLDAESGVCK